MIEHSNVEQIERLLRQKDPRRQFLGRQLLFNTLPPSAFIENYLDTDDGSLQSLENFPMLRQIYDNMPPKLLLKCSRKTLKSTLLSNFIVLNMIRFNNFSMLYTAPQESSTNYFATKYVGLRFSSRRLKKLIPNGFIKDGVQEKILADTKSSCIFRYCKDDATRIRGPATDLNLYDETQDIQADQLPIIRETMTMSDYKHEIAAGTPLTTDNTIEGLWQSTNMLEWATKCGCGRWNTLTLDNEPLKMLKPKGFSCSKCDRVLNTRTGQWVSFNPSQKDWVGYHLAQPLLPHFNESPKEWKTFYTKVTDGKYSEAQIMNEALGISYDVGSKPITEEELRRLCTLGPIYNDKGQLKILNENKHKYKIFTSGTDWGINQITSQTVNCTLALREDLTMDVFFLKTFANFDHESHIREIAKMANDVHAYVASDSGPSPDRGIRLVELTSPSRGQLIRYEHGKLVQRTDIPAGASDYRQNRWCLHRSDTLTLLFKLLKAGKIRFPRWEDCSHELKQILNVFIEVKEGLYRQELFYRHKPTQADDFMHALNFAVMQALVLIGDSNLQGGSTGASDYF